MPRSSLPSLNFLSNRRSKLAVLRHQDKYFLWSALSFLGVVMAVAVILASWSLYNQKQVRSLELTQQQLTNQLQQMSDEQAQYLLFSKRLVVLAQLLTTITSQQESLIFLQQLNRPGTSFHQIEAEKNGKISFQVETDNYFDFESFVDNLRQPEIKDQLATFEISTVKRGADGKYTFQVSLALTDQIKEGR